MPRTRATSAKSYDDLKASGGLGESQRQVLWALRQSNTPMTAGEISHTLNNIINRNNVASRLNELRKKELVHNLEMPRKCSVTSKQCLVFALGKNRDSYTEPKPKVKKSRKLVIWEQLSLAF